MKLSFDCFVCHFVHISTDMKLKNSIFLSRQTDSERERDREREKEREGGGRRSFVLKLEFSLWPFKLGGI